MSNFTKIECGVRQRWIISPNSSNLYNGEILRELEVLAECIIGEHNLNKIRYTDDTVLMTGRERELAVTARKILICEERISYQL